MGPGRRGGWLAWACALLCGVAAARAAAQPLGADAALRPLPGVDITQALVALTHFGATSGLSAGSFWIEPGGGQPTLRLRKLNLQAGLELPLGQRPLTLRAQGALGVLALSDPITLDGFAGAPALFSPGRSVYSGRADVGLAWEPLAGLRLRPTLGLALSRLARSTEHVSGPRTRTRQLRTTSSGPLERMLFLDWTAQAASLYGALALEHEGRWDARRLRSGLTYTHGYHRSSPETQPLLAFADHTDTLDARVQYGAPTGLMLLSRPLGWTASASATHFFSRETQALGFDSLFGVNAGLDWHTRPGPAGARAVGMSVGALLGGGLRGVTLSLSVR